MLCRLGRLLAGILLALHTRSVLSAAEEWPNLDNLEQQNCPPGSEWRTDYFENFHHRITNLTLGGKWNWGRGEHENYQGDQGLEMRLGQGFNHSGCSW